MPQNSLIALDSYFNNNLTVSIITKIEVLGFNGEMQELTKLSAFISLTRISFVDEIIADKTIELRKTYKIKTPDAIIAATALVNGLTLFTRNLKDFKMIDGLNIINPWEL